MSPALIRFDSVGYAYPGGKEAIQDVTLEIGPGEVVAILGGNGAGKTTLVKHLNGLLKPSKGRVTVFGTDTTTRTVAQLSRNVGMVFQNPDHQLFAETVEEELSFALKNLGFSESVIEARIEWALHSFRLFEYRKSSPMSLSAGEKKRLCLACVLAWEPDIVVLDEPTVGQDYAQKERIMEIIRLLQAQAKTVVIVSHDMEFIWPLQPRVILMSQGRVVKEGLAAEVLAQEEVTKASRLLTPQLLQVWRSLKAESAQPFKDVFEARAWISSSMRGRCP